MPDFPIDQVLPELTRALENNTTAVLIAQPGAGKTTRVPLALLDAGWRGDGKIIMLEPRRLAARSAARFMARSLNEKPGQTVGYRVRMDTRVSAATRIEIVTEGVFTRMIQSDPELTGIAVVLFDEFHERNLDGDLGLALALDAQAALRPDLRIVIMSATVDGGRVSALLDGAPVIESAGRSFPVETRHLPRDPSLHIADQTADATLNALRESSGSLLVFLPGRYEIERAARRLEDRLPPDTDLFTLFGSLSGAEQDRAIAPPKAGRRKIVLATAIAETSLTIEGIRVVVDSGLSRRPLYEPATGLTRLETARVSVASADQRRGRAGRLEPGVCYRLWAKVQTGALNAYDRPEILEADLSGLVLDLAQWGVGDPSGLSWLDPPPKPAWSEARDLLSELGALDENGRLTTVGRQIADMPLHPRLAHMILKAGETGDAGLAAEIALILTEQGLGGRSVDLAQRLRVFREDRSNRARTARQLAASWSGRFDGQKGSVSPDRCGAVLAQAYPDRIAQARGLPGGFRLANRRGAKLDIDAPLASEAFLVVAEIQGRASDARILLAAPIAKADIEGEFGDAITEESEIKFDNDSQSVRASSVRRYHALELSRRRDPTPDPGEVANVLSDAIIMRGIDRLPWPAETRHLRERINWLAERQPDEWPDVANTGLAASKDTWLTPFLPGRSSVSEIDGQMLRAGLLSLLPPDGLRRLEVLAPPYFEAPTGRRVQIDYNPGSPPTIAIRVQELYGLDRHPEAGHPPEPILLSLLSPANRPIQTTADLPGFWRGSWRDVRADMRGRYPKHVWPEVPQSAEPTRRAKPRKP